MWLQAKGPQEWLELPEAQRGQEGPLPGAAEGAGPCQHLEFGHLSSRSGGNTWFVSRCFSSPRKCLYHHSARACKEMPSASRDWNCLLHTMATGISPSACLLGVSFPAVLARRLSEGKQGPLHLCQSLPCVYRLADNSAQYAEGSASSHWVDFPCGIASFAGFPSTRISCQLFKQLCLGRVQARLQGNGLNPAGEQRVLLIPSPWPLA